MANQRPNQLALLPPCSSRDKWPEEAIYGRRLISGQVFWGKESRAENNECSLLFNQYAVNSVRRITLKQFKSTRQNLDQLSSDQLYPDEFVHLHWLAAFAPPPPPHGSANGQSE